MNAASFRQGTTPTKTIPPAILLLGVAIGLGFLALPLLTNTFRDIDSILAAGLVFLALMVLARRPTDVVVLIFAYLCFNRLARRLLDYYLQQYSQTPPTSLVVPLLGVLLGLVVFFDGNALPWRLRHGVRLYLAAIIYGAVIGAKTGPAMLFDALAWLSPLGIGIYVAWLRPSTAELLAWIRWFALFAALAMGYGWFQWLTLPPWDQYWMREANMASLGRAAAMECRFFGPFAAPGSAATVGGTVAALTLITPCLAPSLRGPLSVFLLVSTLMTLVRSAWLSAASIVVSWLVLNRSQGKSSAIAVLTLAAIATSVVLPRLPGSDQLFNRLDTLGDVANDGSFKGRVEFSAWAVGAAFSRPLGHGLGSTGLSSGRLDAGSLVAFDSGFLEPLYVLGLPGTLLLCAGLYHLITPLFARDHHANPQFMQLKSVSQAIVLGSLMQMAVSNFLKADYAIFFWIFALPPHAWASRQFQHAPIYAKTTRGHHQPF